MDRLHDAELLSQQLSQRSDSASLLKILALEILLKCAVRVEDSNYRQSHNYKGLWDNLSSSSRERIIAEAENRFTVHFKAEKIPNALPNWQKIFCKGRYEYEEFSNDIVIHDLDAVIESGKPVEGAFIYFPMELDGLIYGLRIILEEQLGVTDDFHY